MGFFFLYTVYPSVFHEVIRFFFFSFHANSYVGIRKIDAVNKIRNISINSSGGEITVRRSMGVSLPEIKLLLTMKNELVLTFLMIQKLNESHFNIVFNTMEPRVYKSQSQRDFTEL